MSLFVGKECYDIVPSEYRDFRDIYVRQRAEASSESFLQVHYQYTILQHFFSTYSNTFLVPWSINKEIDIQSN